MSQKITEKEAIQTAAVMVDGILLAKQIWLTGTDGNRDTLVKLVGNFVFDAVTRLQKMEDEKRQAWSTHRYEQ